MKMKTLHNFFYYKTLIPISLFFFFFTVTFAANAPITHLPSDAVSLLAFKSNADLDNKLIYTLHERRFDYCQWQGVKCAQGRVVRLVLNNSGLRGEFPPNSLSQLDQLRVLSLQNNSLSGQIPDLSLLVNLKSLFLSFNGFSGSFPVSVLVLHRFTTLDLSHNNLTGSIPARINDLDRLSLLKLEFNRFNSTLPPLNLSSLVVFNVSGNNLTGTIPVTPTLSRFHRSSFSGNLYLCGEIINKACNSRSPFFNYTASSVLPPAPTGQIADSNSGPILVPPPSTEKRHKRRSWVVGLVIGVTVTSSLLCIFCFVVKKKYSNPNHNQLLSSKETDSLCNEGDNAYPAITKTSEIGNVSQINLQEMNRVVKSGSLLFCSGESQLYSLEQLMKASAELLGRGTIGTTYKAVLDNHLILTVKRLDANKTGIVTGNVFESHMEEVGRLHHQNLVPMRAYFQSKGERLVIYDYQPNGSLFSLIHGSRSSRAKPLHWTSCLKITEDIVHGLSYIHQVSKHVHGNIKSSNILLGGDFEACLSDYCLSTLSDYCLSTHEDPYSEAYRGPETRKPNHRATKKSDVYAFGILLLELLTGKNPSQIPHLVPDEMIDWVRGIRDEVDNGDDNQLIMLTEIATVCSLTSQEQRPEIWQVLKMIQEIKDNVTN